MIFIGSWIVIEVHSVLRFAKLKPNRIYFSYHTHKHTAERDREIERERERERDSDR